MTASLQNADTASAPRMVFGVERTNLVDTRMAHDHDRDHDRSYDQWFRAQVQAALDDPRPSIPHEAVEAEFAERRQALLAKMKA
jgi:hypothetical protein